MDWKRISGLWSEFQARAKARGNGLPTAQDERASTLREFWTTGPGPGIQDPLVRQMDHRQRMALLKWEIEEIEREVTRFRAMVQEGNDPSTIGQERRTDEQP